MANPTFFFARLIYAALFCTLSQTTTVSPGREGELTAPLNLRLSREGLLQTASRFKGHSRFTSGFMNNRARSACFALPE